MRRSIATLSFLLIAAGCMPGCQLVSLFGYASENYKRTGNHLEEAEYSRLKNKSFAVIVAADRSIQADHPGVVFQATRRISQLVAQNTNATHWVPPGSVLQYQYDNPSWTAMSWGEIAQELGVDRLIVVDLQEYRLHEPGNSYLWAGQAAASVAVIERESVDPDEFAYRKFIEVGFPDGTGLGPSNIPRVAVTSALAQRLTDRVAWLFYDKEVPNDIRY